MNDNTREKLIHHPLEDVFDIDPGTTMVEFKEVLPATAVSMPNYDAKDNEIEAKLEEIYSTAMTHVEVLGDDLARVEGKYKARVGEVTATMLNVALSAVREKTALKVHKDKSTPQSGPTTVNNNLNIMADRNEILRMLMDKKSS